MIRIKLHPEIITKSSSVRSRFIKILISNIRNVFEFHNIKISIINNYDNLHINNKSDLQQKEVINILAKIPGIQNIQELVEYKYTSMHDIYEFVYNHYKDRLDNKTFSVRASRKGKQEFNSLDVEKYVGGGLNQNIASAKVKLKNPDFEIKIDINEDSVFIIKEIYKGLGGFPIGTQSAVLSLISGGFDSAVSSYQMIRRGCKTHYLFFNLGGDEHENGVKQISYSLWKDYATSHKVKFVTIDFQEIVSSILENIDSSLMGVVLKRMFYRAACAIADKYNIDAVITGEALGQVSSQTLANLRVIEEVATLPVLRPLITYDKEVIIDIAREIGSAKISETIPEFCGVISKNPTISANLDFVLKEESKINIDELINKCVDTRVVINIREIYNNKNSDVELTDIIEVSSFTNNDIIIDVRDNYTYEKYPITWKEYSVNIPFFKLAKEFPKLDNSKRYVLYCDQGVLSKLQALHLYRKGYKNLAVVSKEFNVKRGCELN